MSPQMKIRRAVRPVENLKALPVDAKPIKKVVLMKSPDRQVADFVIKSSSARTIEQVSTFRGKVETNATIDRLFDRAIAAAR